jgi:hypothetical protein
VRMANPPRASGEPPPHLWESIDAMPSDRGASTPPDQGTVVIMQPDRGAAIVAPSDRGTAIVAPLGPAAAVPPDQGAAVVALLHRRAAAVAPSNRGAAISRSRETASVVRAYVGDRHSCIMVGV